jgi:hypothetical protein
MVLSRSLCAGVRAIGLVASVCVAGVGPTRASELKQKTADAFQRYVERTEIRIKSEENDPAHFLCFDSLPPEQKQSVLDRLHEGQVVIQQMHTQDGKGIEVPDGLVHHWLAIGFLPGVTREQVLQLAHDYARQPRIYAPDVQREELLSHEDAHDAVEYRFYRQAIVTVVYNVNFDIDYFVPDSSRAYSWSHAVRIAEVQNAGKPDEKEMPVGKDHGYMWRLNLYTNYLEKDGGVYVQIEFLALSRTVPLIFAWLVNPYMRSVPRDYLTHYIVDTQKALGGKNSKSKAESGK